MNMDQDIRDEDEDKDEEMDTVVDPGVGLAPRTTSSAPPGFSRRANQVCVYLLSSNFYD